MKACGVTAAAAVPKQREHREHLYRAIHQRKHVSYLFESVDIVLSGDQGERRTRKEALMCVRVHAELF